LDSSLSNCEIPTRVNHEWPSVLLFESEVSSERIRPGFLRRPPLVKQDLSIAQQQRLQFAINILATESLDSAKIVFSDESRFVLGDDHT
jgi:hypothetical protein